MKKTKLITIYFLFIALLAMCASAVTVTMVTPASNANINGTYNFTATLSAFGTGDVDYCTFSTSADSSFASSPMGNVTSYWNSTDTSGLTEVKSTTVTVACYNSSDDLLGSGTSTGVTIDNTNPICSCSLANEQVSLFEAINYDCSSSTDTSTLTYSCVATYDDGTTETETDEMGIFEDTISLGEASIVCTATDEVSKTNTCSSLTVNIKGDGDDAVATDAKEEEKSKTGLILVIFLVVIVAVTIIMTAQRKKSKKKKR